MSAPVDVSVILCVRNGVEVIENQLAALEHQVADAPFEIIIVDNGSTDGTQEVIRQYLKQSYKLALITRIIDASETPGLPYARNKGARAARADIFAFCDADDRVHERWVQAIADSLKGRDALIGGRVHPVDGQGNRLDIGIGQGLVATKYLPHVSGCNFAITSHAFFSSGGFDEGLPRYGFDDVDFSWRVQESGFSIDYEPKAEVYFTVSGNSASVKKKFMLGVGRVLMARRYPQYDNNSYRPLFCLKNVFSILVRIIRFFARERTINRKDLSVLVASLGNLYGSLIYAGKNTMPPHQILTGE